MKMLQVWGPGRRLPRGRTATALAGVAAVVGAAIAAVAPATPAHAAGDVWVDDAWSGASPGDVVSGPSGPLTIGTDAFGTIAAALATTPTTVHLAAGTYAEQVDITSDVTILGAGAGQSIIARAPGALVAAPGNSLPFVRVHNAATVSITGITVQGSGEITNPPSAPPPYIAGILVDESAELLLDDSAVLDIRQHPDIDSALGGWGILVGTSGSNTGRATITDTRVERPQRAAIIVRPGSTADIARATLIGNGWSCKLATNGLQIQGAATVTDTTISDFRYDRDTMPRTDCGSDVTAQAGAVLVIAPTGPVSVTNSTIQGSDIGLYAYSTGQPVSFTGNTVVGMRGDPMADDASIGFVAIGGAAIAATGNAIRDADVGAYLADAGQTFAGNLVADSTIGVQLDGAPAVLAANALIGNATGIAATAPWSNPDPNWWGCNEGPNSAGCDTADAGYSEPEWLVFTLTMSACIVQEGGTLTAAAAIEQTSGGAAYTTWLVPSLPITPVTGSGLQPTAPTATLSGGLAILTFTGTVPGPASASATAQHQTAGAPGVGTGCASSLMVTAGLLPATGPSDTVWPIGLALLGLGLGVLAIGAAAARRARGSAPE